MLKAIFKLSPARIIALGFALVILLGAGLLMLPCSIKEGQTLRYVDALYTATSAVCVTGLLVVDTADTFTGFGQFVVMMLIQVGGLGVTAVGAGIILAMGKRINLKGRNLIREAGNLDSGKGVVQFLRSVLVTTLVIELLGAAMSFVVFGRDHPLGKALWISVFHSVAAFNNSGFDVLGGGRNLIPYQGDVWLNLVTCALIFFGGIGFLVIRELMQTHGNWKKLSLHAKVVLSVSVVLLIVGTALIKLTEDISWLGAFFFSVSARTAGFSTYPLAEFSTAGLLVISVLMFIGASPGSTGGGIKTSTFFVLLKGILSAATNKQEKAFRYSLPSDGFRKAATILMLGLGIVIAATYLFVVLEPDVRLIDALLEMVSAFGTVGLSTGITPGLGDGAKLLSIVVMYMGRLGPMTVATLWYFSLGERVRYPEGDIAIG